MIKIKKRSLNKFIYDPSLVLYLPLYELDGASFMSKDARGHLCTVTGALWRPQGRSFDGSDDIIQSLTVAGTVMAACWWMKPTNTITPTTPAQELMSFTAPRAGIVLGACTGLITNETFTICGDTNERTAVVNVNISADWHFMTIVWNSGLSRYDILFDLVIQTVTQGSAPGHCPLITATCLNLGWTSGSYAGTLGDLIIYSKPLSFLELQSLCLATRWRYQ